MTMDDRSRPDPPVACNLDALTPGERRRRQDLAGVMQSTVGAIRELPDGFAICFSPSVPLADIRELMELEGRCCSFLTLHLIEDPENPCLRLSGPPGTKEFLLETFGLETK